MDAAIAVVDLVLPRTTAIPEHHSATASSMNECVIQLTNVYCSSMSTKTAVCVYSQPL